MPRPPFKPTEEQRNVVRALAAYGTSHEKIIKKIGVRSVKTLRKYFREDLDLGAIEANAQVAQTIFQMATSGLNIRASEFWMRCRGGWNDRPQVVPRTEPVPFIVAKEEESHKQDSSPDSPQPELEDDDSTEASES